MTRLVWLPPLLLAVLLIAVCLNANLRHPVPLDFGDANARTAVMVGSVGWVLWYTALLAALILSPVGWGAPLKAGVAAASLAVIGALSLTPKTGFLRMSLKDTLVDLPAISLLAFADALVIYTRTDGDRCNPLAWERRADLKEPSLLWGRRAADGRVFLQTRTEVDRGMFAAEVYDALVVLMPDGGLDRGFSERFHHCVAGTPHLVGERLLLLRDDEVEAVVAADGSVLGAEDLAAFTRALTEFSPTAIGPLGDASGSLFASRPEGGERLGFAIVDVAEAALAITGRFLLRRPPARPWVGAIASPEHLLVAWEGRAPPRASPDADARSVEEVLAAEIELLRPDGSRHPGFRLTLDAEVRAALEKAWFATDGLWAWTADRHLLALTVADATWILPLDAGGHIGADLRIEVDGYVKSLTILDEGRLAITHVSSNGWERVTFLRPAGRQRIEKRKPREHERGIQSFEQADRTEVLVRGEILHVGGAGRSLVLSRDAGLGLRQIDPRGRLVDDFSGPSWLRFQ